MTLPNYVRTYQSIRRARRLLLTALLLVICAPSVAKSQPSDLSIPAATPLAPANDTVLSSPAGALFTWTLPPGFSATNLTITDYSAYFGPATGSGSPNQPAVLTVPLQAQQTSYTLPSLLPRGVSLYWSVEGVCATCETDTSPYYAQPLAFGVANPASQHTAAGYIRRVVKGLGDSETGAEVGLSAKCHRPAHGSISCPFKTPGLVGTAKLSTSSGSHTNFDISATQTEGCRGALVGECRYHRHWKGTEAQVCDIYQGLALVPIGDNAGLFCEATELQPYE
jgi:hypothetical protein